METELSLNDYWRILVKRKWIVLFIFLSVSFSVIVYTQFQTPVYRTQALVKFEPPNYRLPGSEDFNLDLYSAQETQVKLLTSRDMAEDVAKRLNWPVEKVYGAYTTDRIENSSLIQISVLGSNPKTIVDLANAVANTYVESDFEQRTVHAKKTLEDIVQRRADEEETLKSIENQRMRFLQDHQGTGLRDELTVRLLELEGRRKEYLKRFTPIHPEIVKLDQHIATVKARLSKVPAQDIELERMNRDISVHNEIYVTLSKKMEEAKIALASITPYVTLVSKAVPPASPISPNKPVNYMMGMVLGVFLGLLMAFVLENLDISISTIEEIEKILGVPVLGIIPHFGSERRWDDFWKTILRKQRYPIEGFRSLMAFHHRSKSPFIEVYHSVRANIQSQFQKDGDKTGGLILTFTSTGVAEGKTLTAINFCLAAAHAGLKTLLIGADVRRPVVHRIFGLPHESGLVDVLTGRTEWDKCLHGTVDFMMGEIDLDKLLSFPGIDNFKIMTGYTERTSDVVNVLNSPRLPKLAHDLRSHFDLVVFDCPPVLLFVDALLIAPYTDGVVMVYKSGKMPRGALKRAKDQVVAAKARIVGVVLNDMHATDMGPRYGAYYDYGHYTKKQETK